jgi:hypothetical protein
MKKVLLLFIALSAAVMANAQLELGSTRTVFTIQHHFGFGIDDYDVLLLIYSGEDNLRIVSRENPDRVFLEMAIDVWSSDYDDTYRMHGKIVASEFGNVDEEVSAFVSGSGKDELSFVSFYMDSGKRELLQISHTAYVGTPREVRMVYPYSIDMKYMAKAYPFEGLTVDMDAMSDYTIYSQKFEYGSLYLYMDRKPAHMYLACKLKWYESDCFFEDRDVNSQIDHVRLHLGDSVYYEDKVNMENAFNRERTPVLNPNNEKWVYRFEKSEESSDRVNLLSSYSIDGADDVVVHASTRSSSDLSMAYYNVDSPDTLFVFVSDMVLGTEYSDILQGYVTFTCTHAHTVPEFQYKTERAPARLKGAKGAYGFYFFPPKGYTFNTVMLPFKIDDDLEVIYPED